MASDELFDFSLKRWPPLLRYKRPGQESPISQRASEPVTPISPISPEVDHVPLPLPLLDSAGQPTVNRLATGDAQNPAISPMASEFIFPGIPPIGLPSMILPLFDSAWQPKVDPQATVDTQDPATFPMESGSIIPFPSPAQADRMPHVLLPLDTTRQREEPPLVPIVSRLATGDFWRVWSFGSFDVRGALPRIGHSAAQSTPGAKKIFIFGGHGSGTSKNNVYVLDTGTSLSRD